MQSYALLVYNPKRKEGALLRAASNLPQQHNHKSPPSAQKKTISKDGDCSNGKVKAYSCCVAASPKPDRLTFAVAFRCFPLLVHVHVVAYKAKIWKNKLLHSNSNSFFSLCHSSFTRSNPIKKMGPLNRIRTKRPLHLLLLMLFLLRSNPIKHSIEGRSLLTLLEVANGRGEEKATVRALVGSRPPICERRCITCGHCEAVQVPVIPQEKKSRSRQFLGTATVRGDYSSNYKPLSWKCKCGDLIFDP